MSNTRVSNDDCRCPQPATRQRAYKEPPALAVPDINDNAGERKRVLNVLAQRRYRERQRQARDRGRLENKHSSSRLPSKDESSLHTPASVSPAPEGEARQTELSLTLSPHDLASLDSSTLSVVNGMSASNHSSPSWSLVPTSGVNEPFQLSESLEASNAEQILLDGVLLNDAGSTSFLDGMDLTSIPESSSSPSSSVSDNITFPDSYYLPMNELTLLRGLVRIATRLRCNTKAMWEIDATSPFNDGTHTPLTTQELPVNWRPTQAQIAMPHHPAIDMLPWPSVRDRLILILNLPEEARPDIATGPLAIVQFAYDLEDTCEGVRIWGDDPYEVNSWEIGQALFQRWWFVFDKGVVDQSNYWRSMRGAAMLTPQSTTTSSENVSS